MASLNQIFVGYIFDDDPDIIRIAEVWTAQYHYEDRSFLIENVENVTYSIMLF